MPETIIQGHANILYVNDADTWRPLACLTDSTWTIDGEILESITKCDPGVTIKTPGTVSHSFDFEGEYFDSTSAAYLGNSVSHDHLVGVTNVKKSYRYSTGLADNPYQYFDGILQNLELSSPADDKATFSGTIEADDVSTTEQTTKL